MNVFVLDYIYVYVTEEGYRGIIRADSKEEAIERKHDFYPNDEVKYIVRLSDLDNDYGVIEENKINEAILKGGRDMKYLLRDRDNHDELNAMITTETLTAKEVQDLIYKMKEENEIHGSKLLTEILEEKGCTVEWIIGDDEVYW